MVSRRSVRAAPSGASGFDHCRLYHPNASIFATIVVGETGRPVWWVKSGTLSSFSRVP